MKKILILLTLAFVTLIIFFNKNIIDEKPLQIEIPPIKEPNFNESILEITEDSCEKKLKYLASDELEGRMSGKKGNILAANFIKNYLEDLSLKTKTQKFKIKRTNPGPNNEIGNDYTENVYASILGSEFPDEIVVIGAHFDHIGYGPKYSRGGGLKIHNGADDNASGTVAVMEVAKVISKLKPKRTILFQFYSAEEMGLLGSRYYCNNPIYPESSPDISKHIAMINLDMVGHLSSKYKVSVPDSTPDIKKIIEKLGQKYVFAENITGRGTGGSDHASFYNKKIPVAFIHTGSHKHYHTPSDDVETLNIEGVAKVSKYAAELVWLIANDVGKPEFDESKFKEMPYTHDHGIEKF